MSNSIIFHIDVNSAFLSWSALKQLKEGSPVDLRTIPSAVGGNEETRHGIVLAKSAPAKAFHIKTGEPLVNARKKCPELTIVPPDYDTYVSMSNHFISLLKQYAPVVDQYSIDEAFCDMSGTENLYGSLIDFATTLKDTIHTQLGFTVNIGVSTNRLLAKMASDYPVPDSVYTLFPEELADKFWPLPIENLFFVGKQTAAALRKYGINTIGDLAHQDKALIQKLFKKHGEVIWNFANGIDSGEITHEAATKGYSNMQTLPFDVTDYETAKHILLMLCETVASRIRQDNAYIGVVGVSIVDHNFDKISRQTTLSSNTNVTERIFETAWQLFRDCWKSQPIRQLGVHTGKATTQAFEQYNIFDLDKYEKLSKLNSAIDSIRNRYGDHSVQRACFVETDDRLKKNGLNEAKQRLSGNTDLI